LYSLSFRRVPPNVFVSTIWLPAPKYPAWIPCTTSACVSFHSSGQAPFASPAANSIVP
jgi:hypothetical protein